MSVALVGPAHPYRGGIAHYNALLCEAVRTRTPASLYNFTRMYPDLLFPGRTQYDESKRSVGPEEPRMLDSIDPRTYVTTARAIQAQAPERVIYQQWHPFFVPSYGAIVAWLKLRAPTVRHIVVCHNAKPHESSAVDRLLNRSLLRAADNWLVHAESELQDVRALLARPEAGAVHPMPPLGDAFERPQEGRKSLRARLGYSDSDEVLLFFGYVRAYKGLRTALEALAVARKRRPLKLLVAGEFYEDRAVYERLINTLGLGEAVQLLDCYIPNEDVASYFVAADLAVQPYVTASQSGITQLAHAFDLPVAATAVGGLPDAIEEGVTGYLVPPEQPELLGARLVEHFEHSRAAAMRDAIRRSRARAGWDSLTDTLLSL